MISNQQTQNTSTMADADTMFSRWRTNTNTQTQKHTHSSWSNGSDTADTNVGTRFHCNKSTWFQKCMECQQ